MYRIYPGVRGTRGIPRHELVAVEQRDETAYYEERGVEPVGGGSSLESSVENQRKGYKDVKQREDHMLIHLKLWKK